MNVLVTCQCVLKSVYGLRAKVPVWEIREKKIL